MRVFGLRNAFIGLFNLLSFFFPALGGIPRWNTFGQKWKIWWVPINGLPGSYETNIWCVCGVLSFVCEVHARGSGPTTATTVQSETHQRLVGNGQHRFVACTILSAHLGTNYPRRRPESNERNELSNTRHTMRRPETHRDGGRCGHAL